MKKKLSWKKISAIGAGAAMAVSLAFGMGFSNLFTNTATESNTVDGDFAQNVEGGGTNREVSSYAASNIIAATETGKLPTYAASSTYWYTDYDEGIKLNKQEAGVTTDRITVTVATSAAKGTKTNPWVIDTKADWNTFVAYVAASSTKGAGEYFVLNNDLNYQSGIIKPVFEFAGTFFGNGHAIQNARIHDDGYLVSEKNGDGSVKVTIKGRTTGWESAALNTIRDPISVTYNAKGNTVMSLFCYVAGDMYLSDLGMQNYTINDEVYTASPLIGCCDNDYNVTVANCLTKGSITAKPKTFPNQLVHATEFYPTYGGIMGRFRGVGKALKVYKCSADYALDANSPKAFRDSYAGQTALNIYPMIGGIVGYVDIWTRMNNNKTYYNGLANMADKSIAECSVTDSYASLRLTYVASGGNTTAADDTKTFFTGFIGFDRGVLLTTVKDCVFVMDAKVQSTGTCPSYVFPGGKFWGTADDTSTVQIDGFYGYVDYKYKNYAEGAEYKTYNVPTVGNCGGALTDPVQDNIVKMSTTPADADSLGGSGLLNGGESTGSLEDFKEAMKGGLTNQEVWNPDVLDGINSASDTPDIVENPIVVSKTRITFQEVDGSELTFTDGGASVRDYETTATEDIPLPVPQASTGKQFVAWTKNKTTDDSTDRYTNFPKGLYGNATMYPVWEMTGVSVSVTPSGEGISATDTTISKEYTGAPVVTLTANLTLPTGLSAADCTITWSWFKNGTKIDGANTNTLVLTEPMLDATGNAVAAQFKATVKVVHGNNVLWRTDPSNDKESGTFDITIDKGSLTPDGVITIDPNQKAYWGQTLNDTANGNANKLIIAPKMKNSIGVEVAGTAVWNLGTSEVGNETADFEATFTPTDTAHYKTRTISVRVTPTILKLEFAFDESTTKFTFDVKYDAQYTGQQLVDMFRPKYFEWLDEGSNAAGIGNNMPKFDSKTDGKFFTEYLADFGTQTRASFKKADIDAFATEATHTVFVTFGTPSAAPYTATFFTKLSPTEDVPVAAQSLYYGQKVGRPELSQAGTTESPKFLQGWFVANAAGEIQQESGNDIPFDFENTHVTENVYLAAKWIQGTLEIDHITAKLAQGVTSITATTQPQKNQYVVTGVYNVRVDGTLQANQVEILLSSADYDLEYTGNYSVNNTTMTVVYVKGDYATSRDKTCDVTNLPINPKYIGYTDYAFTASEAIVPPSGEKRSTQLSQIVFDDGTTLSQKGSKYFIEYSYTKDGVTTKVTDTGSGIAQNQGVDEIGTYSVVVRFDFTKGGTITPDIRCNVAISYSFEIKDQAKRVVVEWSTTGSQDIDGTIVYTYNGSVQHPTATFYLEGTSTRAPLYAGVNFEYTGTGANSKDAASAGYTVSVELKTIAYELVMDDMNFPFEISYEIAKATVKVPLLADDERIYEKDVITDISGDLGLSSKDLELVTIINATAEDVPYGNAAIQTRVRLNDTKNSAWADGDTNQTKTITWYLKPKTIPVPSFPKGRLVYGGEFYQLGAKYLIDFDEEAIVITGESSAKNAGSYIATLKLVGADQNKQNYVWEDDSFDGKIQWSILPKPITLKWDKWSFTQDPQNPNKVYKPKITGVDGITKGDLLLELVPNNAFVLIGTSASVPGSYKLEAQFSSDSSYVWLSQNYTIDDSKTHHWVIKGSSSEQIIMLQWNLRDNGYYTFNNTVIHPEVSQILDERGIPLDLTQYQIEYGGTMDKWVGSYTITATVTSLEDPNTQFRVAGESISYRIVKNAANEGTNPADQPNAGDNNQTNNGTQQSGGKGDNPKEDTVNELPVWQLIVGGISAIGIVVCLSKALGEYGAYKAAKKEAKELAGVSYSVAPFMAVSFLGMGGTSWTVLACVLAGVFFLSFMLMLAFAKKRRAAVLMLKREEARVAEEKEYARLEEQQRRDNELKMMFAAMQQNYQQPQMQYDDMRSLLAETVTALLPTMQQQMQALPPASQPSAEEESLRAQMAAQQEQMAQQQALINELMERQAAQQTEAAPAAASKDDDILSQFEPNEDGKLVSLEESYGSLDDDAKRYYYEIGCYIMERPNVVQNDGKYAVLFKYRGRTLFKLCIKYNAPVLAYAVNKAQAEHVIADSGALDYAKQIVNARIAATDKELG